MSSFIFLRFFAPAILSPNLFQLTPHHTVSQTSSPSQLGSAPQPASLSYIASSLQPAGPPSAARLPRVEERMSWAAFFTLMEESILFYLILYLCMCVCVSVERGTVKPGSLSSCPSCLVFEAQSLSGIWSSPIRLDCLASELQGPVCLHLFNTSAHCHVPLLTWVLGIKRLLV